MDDLGYNVGNETPWDRINITKEKFDEIVALPKGMRPDPNGYIPEAKILSHYDLFQSGVTKFSAKYPNGRVGPANGTFVMPKAVADDLIRRANGDVAVLETMLQLEPGYLGANPVRIDIPNPTGMRMPSGNEMGANEYWIPGGYTGAGVPEVIIDAPTPDRYSVSIIFK